VVDGLRCPDGTHKTFAGGVCLQLCKAGARVVVRQVWIAKVEHCVQAPCLRSFVLLRIAGFSPLFTLTGGVEVQRVRHFAPGRRFAVRQRFISDGVFDRPLYGFWLVMPCGFARQTVLLGLLAHFIDALLVQLIVHTVRHHTFFE
jgi:hypothetical protein